MNYSLVIFASIALLLLLALAWLAFSVPRRRRDVVRSGQSEREVLHVSHLPQIKQALANVDLLYLRDQGYPEIAKRIRKERRHIGLCYLSHLRIEFENLSQLARMVAVLSPNVVVAQELQGLRLRLEFSYRYYLIYFRLVSGVAPLKAIGNLSTMVSGLTIRMETAMSEIGERAALGAELLSNNGGRLDASG